MQIVGAYQQRAQGSKIPLDVAVASQSHVLKSPFFIWKLTSLVEIINGLKWKIAVLPFRRVVMKNGNF
jgi:hypothetical protein